MMRAGDTVHGDDTEAIVRFSGCGNCPHAHTRFLSRQVALAFVMRDMRNGVYRIEQALALPYNLARDAVVPESVRLPFPLPHHIQDAVEQVLPQLFPEFLLGDHLTEGYARMDARGDTEVVAWVSPLDVS